MMGDYYILNSHHEPVRELDPLVWATWYENSRLERIVARSLIGPFATGETSISEVVIVSTVFLGIDHSDKPGAPILYETMVYGGVNHEYTERYSTRQEAGQGHEQVVALIRRDEEKAAGNARIQVVSAKDIHLEELD